MATNPNMVAIQTVTVGSGGAANIEFTNIPQTYTDLYLVTSLRTAGAGQQYFQLTVNNDNGTNKYNQKTIRGDGSTVDTYYSGLDTAFYSQALDNNTSSTFNNTAFYIPNYTSSNKKSISFDGVGEDNATNTFMTLIASLYDSTSAVTSLKLTSGANFAQYSTATLYGVTNYANNQTGAYATGGTITTDGQYWYHTFTSSSTFTPSKNLSLDVLVVAGGGSGGWEYGGGGGAGGLCFQTGRTATSSTAYTVTIGGGGASRTSISQGGDGSNSVFDTITANGGGGGGNRITNTTVNPGRAGGSGGGAAGYNGGDGTAGTSNQTNSGGATGYGNAGGPDGGWVEQGGGGGAGEAGNTDGMSQGGDGLNTWAAWATATNTGADSGYYAGGGGGAYTAGGSVGGLGGGGRGGGDTNQGAPSRSGVAGTANTGGGGGGYYDTAGSSGAGGSGIVIVRYSVNS